MLNGLIFLDDHLRLSSVYGCCIELAGSVENAVSGTFLSDALDLDGARYALV